MNYRRTWWVVLTVGLAGVGMVAVPSVDAAPLATVDGEPIELEAEQLEIDLKMGRATLVGDVRIRHGDLDLRCTRLDARYDKVPAVRWAKATGGVRARLQQVEARAREAEIALDRHELLLRGDVRISRGGAWMRARRASVDLKTHRVTLQNVRGVIPMPSVLPGASKRGNKK